MPPPSVILTGNANGNVADFAQVESTRAQSAESNCLMLVSAPASATSPGTAGQVAYDSTHLYICTAKNTWIRATFAGGF